jgi:hypothetical protein
MESNVGSRQNKPLSDQTKWGSGSYWSSPKEPGSTMIHELEGNKEFALVLCPHCDIATPLSNNSLIRSLVEATHSPRPVSQ